MKTNLNMSYRRVKLKPTNINLKKISNTRSLFTVKYLIEVSTETLILNVVKSLVKLRN